MKKPMTSVKKVVQLPQVWAEQQYLAAKRDAKIRELTEPEYRAERRQLMIGWYRIRRVKGQSVPCLGTRGLATDVYTALLAAVKSHPAGIKELFTVRPYAGLCAGKWVTTIGWTDQQRLAMVCHILYLLGWTDALADQYPREAEATMHQTRDLLREVQDRFAWDEVEAGRGRKVTRISKAGGNKKGGI